jgi:hypothetical protein
MIEWVSVKDRLPEKTGIYLVKLRSDKRCKFYRSEKYDVSRCWFCPSSAFKDFEFEHQWIYKKEKVGYITHWAEINLPD